MAKSKRKAPQAAGPRIVWMPLGDIPPHPDNPKAHDLEAIKASIRRFGFRTPVIVTDDSGLTSEGHGRIKALLAMQTAGEDAPIGVRVSRETWLVPVVRGLPRFASDADEREFLVASNRLVEIGGWDSEQLGTLLAKASDLRILGFSEEERDALLASVSSAMPTNAQPDYDEEIELHVRRVTCPKCGEEIPI